MADREIELGRNLLQQKLSAEVGFEHLAGSLHLPRGKTAAVRFGGALQPAIGLGDVRGERAAAAEFSDQGSRYRFFRGKIRVGPAAAPGCAGIKETV